MAKYNPSDPDTLKIPAFQRKVAITNHARQKLLWTALDRKEAGVKPNSERALGTAPRGLRKYAPPIPQAQTPEQPHSPTFNSPLEFDAPPIIDTAHPPLTRAQFSTQTQLNTKPQQSSAPSSTPLARPKKLKPAGEITHYLEKIDVAIIKLSKGLQNGDIIIMEGSDCLFIQPVKEMQIDRNPVEQARKGDHIGMKVGFTAKIGGKIYLA